MAELKFTNPNYYIKDGVITDRRTGEAPPEIKDFAESIIGAWEGHDITWQQLRNGDPQ